MVREQKQPDPVRLPGQTFSAQEFSALTRLDSTWLPPHSFLGTGGRLYLIVDKTAFLPHGLRWQGFGVGKMAKGALLPYPGLRLFVPPTADAESLILDEPRDVHALLAGQSRPYEGNAKQRPLYFRNLPLGFLTVKGRRCLWSDR